MPPMYAAQPPDAGRDPILLLEHFRALCSYDEPRLPARQRLDALLGDDLARLLVSALSAHDGREHARRVI
jgi:hypothetical protein